MLVSILLLLFSGKVTVEPVLRLETPPEDQDLYLQNVLHLEIDDKGRFYVSDFPSARIFYWHPDGSFGGTFGRKGEGPGEFSFAASLGPPMGYINVLGDQIFIYDGGSRAVSVLDRDFNFQRRISFEGLGGKINNFQVLAKDRFLFYDSYFCEKKACRRILEYDGEGKLVKTWRTSPDTTWSANQATGKVDLFIWEPILVMDYSRKVGEVVLAHSSQPVLDIYDGAGEKLRSLRLDIPIKAVTRDDIEEYNKQDWVQGNEHVKIIFPEEKDYFDQVLILPQGYLVYHLSPLYGTVDGFLISREGKTVGRVKLTCGEGGALFAPRGRLMASIVDEDGEFRLGEMKLVTTE